MRENVGREACHSASDLWLPNPSPHPRQAHAPANTRAPPHRRRQRAVSGHSDCGELAAAPGRQQTSLLSRALFFSRSLKRLRSGDMCGTAPCTGAQQVLGEEKSAPCVLTQGSFNSSPRIALGRAATSALAGCRESECEKVSQAEGNGVGVGGRLQVLRQNTFFLLSLCLFCSFKPNPQAILIPRDKGESH